jgi:hypothetical protein
MDKTTGGGKQMSARHIVRYLNESATNIIDDIMDMESELEYARRRLAEYELMEDKTENKRYLRALGELLFIQMTQSHEVNNTEHLKDGNDDVISYEKWFDRVRWSHHNIHVTQLSSEEIENLVEPIAREKYNTLRDKLEKEEIN